MEVRDKKVVVVGLAASGLAAVRLLRSRGASVTATDRRDARALGETARRAEELGATVSLGGHPVALFDDADLVVVSPGVPPLSEIKRAEERGVPVISEVELASAYVRGLVIGVTGTNGKSTVTSLIGEMCKATGRATFAGGNLGTPLSDAIDTPATDAGGVAVVELSSFQLERVRAFRAHVAVLLNVTEDHLDRYASFGDYAAAKAAIFANQTSKDTAIVPDGDALCARLASRGSGQRATFGGDLGEVRLDGATLFDSITGLRVPVRDLRIQGGHNALNACAAALCARVVGVERGVIESVVRSFSGLPHRMVHVGVVAGVDYFDDSKATNVGAAVAALDSVAHRAGKVVLVAGGRDKGGSYEPLRARIVECGRAVVLIGEAAPRIREALGGLAIPVESASTLQEAVRIARAAAQAGDAVLLAPACSSYDMFVDYRARGKAFKRAVESLRKEP